MDIDFLCASAAGGIVIFDTDMGPDCDDAGALALTLVAERSGGFRLAGVINCTSNPYACGAADAIATAYGRLGLAFGSYGKPGFLDDCMKFNRELALSFPTSADKVSDGAELYLRLLSECEDGGAILLTVGQLNVLAEAIRLDPELVNRRSRALVSMAGIFPSGKEYNIVCDADSARYVFENYKKPIFLSGFEVGDTVLTGYCERCPNNPVAEAYRLYTDGKGLRSSWDPITALFAINGANGMFSLSEPGRIRVAADGTNTFDFSPDGNCRYLIKTVPDAVIAEAVNRYLLSYAEKADALRTQS